MQNRLSLASLKAKSSTSVVENTEIYMGGAEECCHRGDCKPVQGTVDGLIKVQGGSIRQ
jgi:hypothetical protein